MTDRPAFTPGQFEVIRESLGVLAMATHEIAQVIGPAHLASRRLKHDEAISVLAWNAASADAVRALAFALLPPS